MAKQARKPKKLIYGVGLYDTNIPSSNVIDGVRIECPFYSRWRSMLNRCYSEKAIKKRPNYKNCTVAPVWHSFMNFRQWMMFQDWRGNHLDKDIIKPNNKVYSPENCVFVSPRINSLLIKASNKSSNLPTGVYWHKNHNKYVAKCGDGLRQILIGEYNSADRAHRAYINYKSALVEEIAREQINPNIKKGLLLHAKNIRKINT